ncbi:MAG: hypothetical protein ABJA62_04875 [Luteimonas sp.]
MNLRAWLLCLGIVAGIGWWYSPVSPRVPKAAVAAVGTTVTCPPPPRVIAGDPPLQSAIPAAMSPFRLQAATLQPLAGFSVDARVLSREDYTIGRESELSPTDLALGWQRMREDAVLSRLDINQSSRWYRYRWQGNPPLPLEEIVRSSANMHMIPSNQAAAAALRAVRTGDRVRIDGWLVEADAPDGWRWRSSMTREDSGNGACEVVYVCAIVRQ